MNNSYKRKNTRIANTHSGNKDTATLVPFCWGCIFPCTKKGVNSKSIKYEAHYRKYPPLKWAQREQILVAANSAKISINFRYKFMKYQCLTLVNFPASASFSAAPDIVCSSDTAPTTVPSGCLLSIYIFPYLPANMIIIPVVWSSCSRGSVLDLSFRGCLRFELGLLHGRTIWIGPFEKAHLQGNIWKQNPKQIDPRHIWQLEYVLLLIEYRTSAPHHL